MSEREDPWTDPSPPRSERRPRPERKRKRSYVQLLRDRRIGPTAAVAVAALIGLIVWLVVESGGGSSSKPTATTTGPEALSRSGLTTLAGAFHQPVFWLGAKPGVRYELTQRPNGFLLRYLPKGVQAGSNRAFLAVGTYTMVNAYDVMSGLASRPDTVSLQVPGGGIGLINRAHRTSVYVAYPGTNYQIEVYDPNPAVARRFATSGRVRPVVGGVSPSKGPVAATVADLKALSTSLGHPVYWVGPRANVTYELKLTPDGQTYIRYLPKGVAVGANKALLTVATYPVTNAFAVTQGGAKGSGVKTISIPGGGIGVYTTQLPTNVHLAYPGVDAQVEVYDPSPKVPPKLVASGKVVPVS